jgi:hypothetical protein
MEPYAGVDYKLTLRPLQSRLQHTCAMGNPTHARVNFIPRVRDSGFCLWASCLHRMEEILNQNGQNTKREKNELNKVTGAPLPHQGAGNGKRGVRIHLDTWRPY